MYKRTFRRRDCKFIMKTANIITWDELKRAVTKRYGVEV